MRLFENVFSDIEFDCRGSDGACMKRTSKIRSDAKPFIDEVVRKRFLLAHELLRSSEAGNKAALLANACPYNMPLGPVWSVIVGIGRAFSLADYGNRTQLERDLLQVVVPNFRGPLRPLLNGLQKVVKKYYPSFMYNPYMRGAHCHMKLNGMGSDSRNFALAMYHATGYSAATHKRLNFGELMVNFYKKQGIVVKYKGNVTEGMKNFAKSVSGIFDSLLALDQSDASKNNKIISAKDLKAYLQPLSVNYDTAWTDHGYSWPEPEARVPNSYFCDN